MIDLARRALFVVALAFATNAPAQIPTPERVEEVLAAGHYAEAESLAMEMLGAAEEGSLEAAEALGLALQAARVTGSIPLDVLPRVSADVLAIQRRLLPDTDPRIATTYHELGNTHMRRGDHDAAAEAYAEALQRRRLALGPRDPLTARSALGLANARMWQGRLDEARALYEESLTILEAAYGERHLSVIRALNAYALLLQRTGDRAGAEIRLRRARDLAQEVLDPLHLDRALVERNLGELLLDERPLEAEPSLEIAYSIRRSVLPADDLLVGHAAASLGEVQARLGRVREAQAHLREAITILARSRPDRERVAELRVWLAQALVDAGRFDEAADAIDELERAMGDAPTPEQSTRLIALRANRAAAMGDYATARPLYESLLQRRADELGEDSAGFARALHNHAEVLQQEGDVEAAVQARRRAVAIQERRLAPDDPDLARGRLNLASSLLEAGAIDEAFAQVQTADAELRNALGDDAPDRANVLLLRARVQIARGEAVRAVDDARRGVALRASNFGPDHVEVGWAQEILAQALLAAGRLDEARKVARASADLAREQLRLAVRTLPERQALAFVGEARAGRDVLIELATSRPDDRRAVREAFDVLVRTRALVLDEMIDRRRAEADASPEREQLQSSRRALLAAVTGGRADAGRVRRLREDLERAESALARASTGFRERRDLARIGADAVIAALPPGSALVAFALNERVDGQRRLAVFVVADRRIDAIDLGPADAIDRAIELWLEQARRPITDLDGDPVARRADHDLTARDLARRIWDPLEQRLVQSGAAPTRIWWVADASLHRVQPLALVDARGQWLALGAMEFTLLDTERDLALGARGADGSGLLAVGAPDFGALGDDAMPTCPDLSTLRFAPLPASLDEVRTLTSSDGAALTLLTGIAASESTVVALAGRHRDLHLATHGFFLDPRCNALVANGDARPDTRGIGGVVRRRASANEPLAPRAEMGLGPLLRAGLALAGANTRTSQGDPARDGLLLAEEIATLDLSKVQTVVLSACDTGVGTVLEGEGVLGLRRAFRRAGARDVVMSLWPVQDEATRAWMGAFYRERAAGADATRALTRATRAVIEQRQRAGLDLHPFFWAPFVCSGRP